MRVTRFRNWVIGFAPVFALMVVCAQAAAAPGVTTEPASSPRLTSAVLNGTVDPKGVSTSYWFEYGKTTSYGSKTAVKSVNGSPVTVKALITGLDENTLYHFRLVASSKEGEAKGLDATFATKAWRIGGQTLAELGIEGESFASSGAFTLEFSSLGTIITCTETGEGEIGGEAEAFLEGCGIVGQKSCAFEPVTLSLTDRFLSVSHPLLLELIVANPGLCSFFETSEYEDKGFVVEPGAEAIELPITLSQTAFFGENATPVTIKSTWTLTGPRAGQKLAIF